MKVLVCGGRDFTDSAWLNRALDLLNTKTPITFMVFGGAKGADQMAATWARARNIPHKVYVAQWTKYGPAAGPRRNQLMLSAEQPALVVAFPGGAGTADMMAKARSANVRVEVVVREKVALKVIQGGLANPFASGTALRQRPPPPGRMTTKDAKALGALCDICPLSKGKLAPLMVPASRVTDPKFIIVGEGPGRVEDAQGVPFCLGPSTLVLMSNLTWKTLDKVQVGDEIISVNEEAPNGAGVSKRLARKFELARVTAKYEHVRPAWKLKFASGMTLVATEDHRVLAAYKLNRLGSRTKRRWLRVDQLMCTSKRGSSVASIGVPWSSDVSRDAGWLAGFMDGEGFVAGSKSLRVRRAGEIGFVQNAGPTFDHALVVAKRLGFALRANEKHRSLLSINVSMHAKFAGGTLASMCALGRLRPVRLLEDFKKVVGRISTRKLPVDKVLSKTFVGERRVIDITTTSGTFIANGLIVHNCGPTGQFLNRLLQEARIDRRQGHIANVSLCRGDTDKEKQRAAECCSPRLLRELAELPADIPIMTLGKLAMKPVLGMARLFLARGFYWKAPEIDESTVNAALRKSAKVKHPDLVRKAQTIEGRSKLAGRVVLPTVHPAFVLRADVWKPVIQADVRRFGRVLRGELTEATLVDKRTPYKVYAKPENVRRFLAKFKSTVAIDIESDGVDPLILNVLCVGISDGERTLVIGPWDPTIHADILTAALKKRRAVFHNGVNFDILALRKDGVVIDDDSIDDTIIAHHVIGSCYPQRLDHCVSVYLDASPWKIKFGRKGAEEKGIAPKHMEPKELYMYNAADAVLTINLWDAMQDDLAKYRDIYAHDMRLARISLGLIATGVGVDVERREFLRQKMRFRANALKGMMRKLVKNSKFNPDVHSHVRQALFKRFHAPVLMPTPTGLPSTASGTLEVYRNNGTKAGTLCDLVLKHRAVTKSRSTYIEALTVTEVSGLGPRIRVNWKVYGTPTGRWSSRLQSVPRPEKTLQGKLLLESRCREIYVARPGTRFVYFDISQAEARIAAYISGDPAFIETCKGDVHTGNACAIFPQYEEIIRGDTKGRGKPYRDVAKNFMFGIVYGAAADTIHKFLLAKGFKVTLREVNKLLDLLRKKYRVYFSYVDRNVRFVEKHGYLISPYLFRRRQFGFHPKPEEVYNMPPQSGVADEMNMRLLEITDQLPSNDILLAGQFHDAAAFETPLALVDPMQDLLKRVWARPSVIPKSIICANGAEFMLPIDLKVADRLSELA